MKRLTKGLLALALLATASVAQAQSVDEIIDKHVAHYNYNVVNNAVGMHISMVMSASVQGMSMEIPMEMWTDREGRMRADMNMDMGGMAVSMNYITDGDVMYMKNSMAGGGWQEVPMEQGPNSDLLKGFNSSLDNWKEAGWEVSLKGSETVNGIACHVLSVKQPDDEVPNNMYLSKANGEIVSIGQEGESSRIFFTDYTRTPEGFLYAQSWSIETEEGTNTISVEEFELLNSFDESLLERN